MRSLTEIGLAQQTDKASHHHYLSLYDLLFGQLKYKHIKILEIGVQFGNSLRTWREYFVYAHIIGIDSVDNGVHFKPEDGIVVEIGDAYSNQMLTRIGDLKFDIIIDDGSHAPQDQIWFVEHYSHFLTHDGILIVEDVLSPTTITALSVILPKEFNYAAVDMTEGNSQVDSRLFLVWKKAI